MKLDQGHNQHKLPRCKKMKEFDIPGALVLICGMTCALLGLQWDGVVSAWNRAVVVALLVDGCSLLVVFVPTQARSRDSARLPLRILGEHNVTCTTIYHIMGATGITVYEYFLSEVFPFLISIISF
jgi:hypothetical protein